MNVESKRTYSADEIKAEVRRTVAQLNELTRTQGDFNQFVQTVLNKIVALTGSHGALLWQVNGQGTPQITHATGNRIKEIVPDTEKHSHLVTEVIAKETPLGLSAEAVVVAGESQTAVKNTSPFLLLFAPIHNRKEVCCGTIELLQRSDITQSAQDGYLNFLGQIAKLFPRWHEQQDLRRLSNKESTWHNKMQFVTEVHRSIELKETTFAMANEIRRLLNCDRVSVARWFGSKCKIDAISSQDKFDNRSNVVRKLGAVATSCVATDTTLWLTGDTEGIAPNLAKLVNDYLDESHSRTFIVLPLLERPREDSDQSDHTRRLMQPKKMGAVIIEYFDAEVVKEQVADDFELLKTQSELALANAETHGTIFMQPLLQRVGWMQQLLFRDHRVKTIVGVAALLFVTLFLCFFPVEHRMKIHGVLQPVNRSDIHTITDGVLQQLFVDHGEKVKEGVSLFVQENFDIEAQASELKGKIEATRGEIEFQNSLMGTRITSDEKIKIGATIRSLEEQLENYYEQQEILKRREDSLTVKSTMDGTVLTWDAKNRLEGKPFAANSYVLTIADYEGDWELKMKIPQGKVGYINRALNEGDDGVLQADYFIATNPNEKLNGELIEIAERAEIGQSGQPEFQAIITADMTNRSALRPGVGVTARVHCGKRPIGFVWTYQIIDYFRTWFF